MGIMDGGERESYYRDCLHVRCRGRMEGDVTVKMRAFLDEGGNMTLQLRLRFRRSKKGIP